MTRRSTASRSPRARRRSRRLPLAPCMSTIGSCSSATAGPNSSTCSRPPATSTRRPAAGWLASIHAVAKAVIAALTLSAAAAKRKMIMPALKKPMPGVPAGHAKPSTKRINMSDFPPLDLFLQRLDLLVHPLKARIDLERLAIGVERVLVVTDVLHDEAKARQRPEMPRLAGQHLADIGNRIHVVSLQEINRGAAVPCLSEVRLDLDDGTEHANCEIVFFVVGCLFGAAHQQVRRFVAGPCPHCPDMILNCLCTGVIRRGFQCAEQKIDV